MSDDWQDEAQRQVQARVDFTSGISIEDLDALGSLISLMRQAHNWAAGYQNYIEGDFLNGRIPSEWEGHYNQEISEAEDFCDLIKQILHSNGTDV